MLSSIIHPLHTYYTFPRSGLIHLLSQMLTTVFFYLYFNYRCRITVKVDDDMLTHYCNEDTFLLDINRLDNGCYDVTLIELANQHSPTASSWFYCTNEHRVIIIWWFAESLVSKVRFFWRVLVKSFFREQNTYRILWNNQS